MCELGIRSEIGLDSTALKIWRGLREGANDRFYLFNCEEQISISSELDDGRRPYSAFERLTWIIHDSLWYVIIAGRPRTTPLGTRKTGVVTNFYSVRL